MNKHCFGRTPAWFAVTAIAVTFGAQGCGGSDPLRPAHSASFFPVRGTADSGAATTLNWVYRVNGGQPVSLTTVPGLSVRFDDESVTSDGAVITSLTSGHVATTDGSVSGTESVTENDHLTSDSPATVSERDVDTRLSLSSGGMNISEDIMYAYAFGTTPLPTFFDRDDLDTLALGFAESRDNQAAVNASVTLTATGMAPQSQMLTTSITDSQSWTLLDKLATFQVLDHSYTNVVKVQRSATVVVALDGSMQQGMSTLWLAKGIGVVREEDSGSALGTSDTIVTELVRTNLVGP